VASNRTSALDFGFSTVVGLLISAAALGLIIITVDALTPNKRLAWVVGIFVGIMIGLVGAVAVGSVIDLVAGAWDLKESSAVYLGLVKVTIGIVLVYLSVSVVLTTRDDLRLVIPYVEFAKQVRGARPLLLDTSVLIDGRFEDLGRTGILDAPVVVAQFVIDELQALADSGDGTKRQRGRRGLDVLQRLQGNPWIDLEIEDFRTEGRSTDRALVEVAKAERFRIVTTDTGLERVAQINGVACLNLNAVATAMRTGQVTVDVDRDETLRALDEIGAVEQRGLQLVTGRAPGSAPVQQQRFFLSPGLGKSALDVDIGRSAEPRHRRPAGGRSGAVCRGDHRGQQAGDQGRPGEGLEVHGQELPVETLGLWRQDRPAAGRRIHPASPGASSVSPSDRCAASSGGSGVARASAIQTANGSRMLRRGAGRATLSAPLGNASITP
jgi:uncharacterized protein YacL